MSIPTNSQCNPRRPSQNLNGRVALVTGAGSRAKGIGNGRATSILLAESGARIVCVDSNFEWAADTVSMIEDEMGKGKAVAVQADVTDAAACQRAVDTALETFGRLDILVNNVGVGGPEGTAIDVDPAQWAVGLEVNVTSMMLMAKAAIPAMARNEKDEISGRGCIVNVASVAGLVGGTPMLLYPTSKGAVVNMTRAMAVHHAPLGIRVNCVCPGMLYTPMLYANGMAEDVREARKNRSLLKTEGNGWDTGCAIRFLASDQARWITGIALPVDAGATAAPAGDGMSQGMSSTLAGGTEKAKL